MCQDFQGSSSSLKSLASPHMPHALNLLDSKNITTIQEHFIEIQPICVLRATYRRSIVFLDPFSVFIIWYSIGARSIIICIWSGLLCQTPSGKVFFAHIFQMTNTVPLTNTLSAWLFQHFYVMENFTNTCKKSLCPWLSATSISWSPPSPSQFTEVLSKRHGSLSSRYLAQCP